MDGRVQWVLLSYRLPREPSTPRITIWRRLRGLGVAQIGDGLVALPLDARNREQLEWIADEAIEHGGTASIWIGVLASASDERRVVESLAGAVADEYRAVAAQADEARSLAPVARRRTSGRLRRELRRIRRRDYFPPAERDAAIRAVDDLAALAEEPA
jgi:hypothetical protein